jgi:hypothetical protein
MAPPSIYPAVSPGGKSQISLHNSSVIRLKRKYANGALLTSFSYLIIDLVGNLFALDVVLVWPRVKLLTRFAL